MPSRKRQILVRRTAFNGDQQRRVLEIGLDLQLALEVAGVAGLAFELHDLLLCESFVKLRVDAIAKPLDAEDLERLVATDLDAARDGLADLHRAEVERIG